ncbi:MAG: hypothetical protein ACFFEF_15260 [Candidatus Thorarchaeota archaeon]
MRLFTFFCVLILLTTILPGSASEPVSAESHTFDSAQDNLIQRDWTINIVLVNYKPSVINEMALLDNLPVQRIHSADPISIQYDVSYEVFYTNESYTNDIRQVILDNSVNGTNTGTWLDESALLYQKDHVDEPQRIFYPRDGIVIDANAVEDWLAANPAVTPPGLGYMYYIFNFTEFDSPDHAIEHWYDYNPIDPDTGETQNWFRLEWDNDTLNPDVKLQYSGFGGRENLFVLDPSADQWYLKWARIWWETVNDYEYMSKDLDEKLSEIDLSTPAGIMDLNLYLSEYIQDPVANLFVPESPMSAQNDVTTFANSGYLKSLVVCMDVATGVSIDSLRWVTNQGIQQAHLEELLPFVDWTVDVEFIDIDSSPGWSQLFWNYAEVIDGQTIVDGLDMFYAIMNAMRPSYIDEESDGINVFGVVFIKKNMEMHVYGRQYTGLGGGGQTVIWKAWDRYYRPDGITPKSGISSVQLHETMHAIGLGHTWSVDHYVADFAYTPMGYYGDYNGTGKFDKNWVQATYLDQLEGNLWMDFADRRADIGPDARQETLIAEQLVIGAFNRARDFYNVMDWMSCFNELQQIHDLIEILMYSISDTMAPEIIRWGIEGSVFYEDNLIWATVMDDLSGVMNVSVHVNIAGEELVYPCVFTSGNWTTTIDQLPVDVDIEIWIEATDRGLNSASSNIVRYEGEYPPYNPLEDPVAISGLIIGSLAISLVIIWFIRKRSIARIQ